MATRVDLVWLGGASRPPLWKIGSVVECAASAPGVNGLILQSANATSADAWLFWDSALLAPDPEVCLSLLRGPGDLWHAGLTLGEGGRPGIADLVIPTWTLNRDPDPHAEATSWRISLRACLVRTSVLRWGAPRGDFASLAGAALEWGHRCIMYGVLPRFTPTLLGASAGVQSESPPLVDELRFARHRFGVRWAGWAAFRAILSGYAALEEVGDAWIATRGVRVAHPPRPFVSARSSNRRTAPTISVLIPTLERYSYLRTVLAQLRTQTVPPSEIIVIDQTPAALRDESIARDFADLPLVLISLDQAGQCTSRNVGLARAKGDAILFLDDDDEIDGDLIARHLAHLAATGAEVSSGVAREPGSGPLPEAFTRERVSDVFPTHNTLALRSALERSGLFDLAYDHGTRADGDLGMRIYLAGAVMWLAPSISVLHHHAPRGGLRAHKARIITYGSSRRRITQRHLPDVTELYRAMRYFSPVQVREMVIQSALGTLSAHGSIIRRMPKLAYGLALMPLTIVQLRRRLAAAREMLGRYPQIPSLAPRSR